ncbi:MAG: flavodoxin family protein [Halobacteriota archaeon]
MKALIIYDSLFGNTEKVARALASGLKEGGVDVDCVKAAEMDVGGLRAYDVLVIGSPTHKRGLSEPMKAFTERLNEVDVTDVKGFAFDTKQEPRLLTGSAGKRIEQKMKQRRVLVVKPHASAIVLGREGPLAEGVEARFTQIGIELGRLVHDERSLTEAQPTKS